MSEKSELNKNPKFIKDLGDDKYEVTCKHETYTLEERDAETFDLCRKLADNSNGKHTVDKLLLMRSIIEPKIDESKFGKIKGSDYMKLQLAINHIYGLNDFLQ